MSIIGGSLAIKFYFTIPDYDNLTFSRTLGIIQLFYVKISIFKQLSGQVM